MKKQEKKDALEMEQQLLRDTKISNIQRNQDKSNFESQFNKKV